MQLIRAICFVIGAYFSFSACGPIYTFAGPGPKEGTQYVVKDGDQVYFCEKARATVECRRVK